MKIEVKGIEKSAKEVTITFPEAVVEEAVQKELKKLALNAKIKGFRPGKAPLSAVRKNYGGTAFENASHKLMDSAIGSSLESESINYVSRPTITGLQSAEGGDLQFTYVVDVFPEVDLELYRGFDLVREVKPLTDADVAESIGHILQERSELQVVDREARTGDHVVMDFAGKIDGEYFDGGTAERYALEIGSGQFIPGFEPQLEGLKAGDAKVVHVTFPETYHAEGLKGKAAEFEVTVHEVQEKVAPELTDELAQTLLPDQEGVTVESYRTHMRGVLASHLEEQTQSKLERMVADNLIEKNPFDVPQSMIDSQARQIAYNMIQRYMSGRQNFDQDAIRRQIDTLAPMYHEIAERQVRTSVLLHKIAEVEKIEPSAEEMDAELVRQAGLAGMSLEDLKGRMNPEMEEAMKATLIERKVMTFIIDNSTVVEKIVEDDESAELQPQS
ncbi:trigger factor [Chrysiogenes arsenatis]|uniref:trigger factor n=1 Tax=Chrysiogenes arsenatis TaxID=309797 RepID=UPI00041B8715|nr:trigger factor [Chrysiogenes arsenatis]